MAKDVFWVPHTHWDREWYRSFQAFRARLVDTIDLVLDLLAEEPEFKFLLDGQTIVLEDYLEVRPDREDELNWAIREGRLGIGPWYVQPDSLLPHGEAHIRNLLMGRDTAAKHGPISRVAYTPDSFGHPAQFPQIFNGFGFKAFIYWRGNDAEIDKLPSDYLWQSPDGSTIPACLLYKGYFNGAMLPADTDKAIDVLKITHYEASEKSAQDAIIIMNGIDHSPPRRDAVAMAKGLAEAVDCNVNIQLLDSYAEQLNSDDLPGFSGELIGGRIANLLPGVWSARLPLKIANRHCEMALLKLAEPMAALAEVFGLRSERASLRAAWRALLKNQAHDSIGGCSIDLVHRQMQPRFVAALSLAEETSRRVMEHLAGQNTERQTPLTDPFEIAVFNPTPTTRSGIAHLPLDALPALASSFDGVIFHPVLAANNPDIGFECDGKTVRLVPASSDGRFFFGDDQRGMDLEIPVEDIPPFGYKRLTLTRTEANYDKEDDGSSIEYDGIKVCLAEQGTVDLTIGDAQWNGLFGIEDLPDRGDSYDADLLADDGRCQLLKVKHRRLRHSNGTQVLEVERMYRLPRELEEDRQSRGSEETAVRLYTDFVLYPGQDHVEVRVRLRNTAKDHRLRVLFPNPNGLEPVFSATTLDVVERGLHRPDDSNWVHPAAHTHIHQGWNTINNLTVASPGLPEAEILEDGSLAITLVRSVGWLSRHDMQSRPGPAGPVIPADEAQCIETIETKFYLFKGMDPAYAETLESPMPAVFAGDKPVMEPGHGMINLQSEGLVISSIKPAERGGGIIIRLLNPTDKALSGILTCGFPLTQAEQVSTDEQHKLAAIAIQEQKALSVELAPHQLLTIRLQSQE